MESCLGGVGDFMSEYSFGGCPLENLKNKALCMCT